MSLSTLIIDNYDSFTYNLYQYTGEILEESGQFNLDVVRNDKITAGQVREKNYDRIIISPGPGHPADPDYFGICADVIREFGPTIPLLGVCLGMQGICTVYGGSVVQASLPMHGKFSPIEHDAKGIFNSLPQNIEVMRYHSLIAEKESLPASLEVTATTTDSEGNVEIMGVRHREYPIEGIQFHPESFGTEGGRTMLRNFLSHRVSFQNA